MKRQPQNFEERVSVMHRQLQSFHERASIMLAAISELVLPGAKLTLLVRRPEAPDGSQDIVLTDDDLAEVIRAVEIRREAPQPEATKPAEKP